MDTLVYRLGQGLYINLTNRCNNDCTFCERQSRPGVAGYCLWLKEEPAAEAVLEELKRQMTAEITEVVFCGYGEPTLRLDTLVEIARETKKLWPDTPIRINTNGLANLEYGEDVTAKLAGCIDTVSISLNAPTSEEYDALCRPAFDNGLAHKALIDFAKAAKAHVPCVVMTVVDVIGSEAVEACRKIAEDAGVNYRVRPMEAL